MVLAISFVFAWMRLKSGSLWTGALLHASHNLYVQSIFTPLTNKSANTAWFIDEFGAVLPVVTIAFAIFFWSRRASWQPLFGNPRRKRAVLYLLVSPREPAAQFDSHSTQR